ncbi:MAG: PBP1A family penicillin-binding protein [Anaerolineae bacterium]|nr:PBP1A family penicillin-binding protein [Anaerolineae bacterium]
MDEKTVRLDPSSAAHTPTQKLAPQANPDDVETGPMPWEAGSPTDYTPRTPTGTTPTTGFPRPIPPPERAGYVAPKQPATPPPVPPEHRQNGSCLLKSFFFAALVVVLLFFLVFAGIITGYTLIAAQLPAPEELTSRQTTFVSSKIYDRDGNLLYELIDPQGGRRTYVPIERISPYLIQATIATEDENFYRHPGFDPIAMVRMIYYALSEGEIVSGGSTIPQQVARNLLLSPEERVQVTAARKIKEIILAYEITRRYPRNTILEIYLNENNYGHLAYGIQAAAETYFGVDAADLTLAQASFLAGLPQSPATYDVFSGGRDQALRRQLDVLRLMTEQGFISQAEAAAAAAEIAAYEFTPPFPSEVMPAPHFVAYVRQVVEATYGADMLYRGEGLRIYTTLDPDLQALAEEAVATHVAALADYHATNGALVAIEPSTGHIVAMVGSADFYNEEIDGQVNVALRERQPGSSIKPLTYIAAFEQGWTPATVIWDMETQFPDGANPPYVPHNYDDTFHGPVSIRAALANSYNIPAVKTLQFIGVPTLIEMAERLGITTLTRDTYGLSLTLGGGEVKLLEMVGAYAVFANQGIRVPPTPILRIEDADGDVLVDNSAPSGEQVIRPEHAYLITHILSDHEARCPAFGCPNPLELSRPAAAKTGTTNDYRDAWAIGYTPDLVTGVWVGNADNSTMLNIPGSRGAAPIWHDFMEAATGGTPIHPFERPAGIVEMEVCADSGTQPSEHCPQRRTEIFAADQPPPGPEADWHQYVQIDAFSGLLANEHCPNHITEQVLLVITDPQGREWAQTHGWPLAPIDYCNEGTTVPLVHISQPASGATVDGQVTVVGTVELPNFNHYDVEFGVGGNPQGMGWVSGPHLAQVRDGVLATWDTSHLSPGLYTLRIKAWDNEGHTAVAEVQCYVATSTATPTLTPLPTDTPTPTLPPTEAPTDTPTPTLPPTDTPAPPPTDVPTAEPTAIPPTDTPTETPTDTPTPEPTPTP